MHSGNKNQQTTSVKKKSIKLNYLMNSAYQIFLIIVPVIVTPYVSRVLGVDGSGRYSYSYSISAYFTLFSALGFDSYAQRLIASDQGNRFRQSCDFWEIIMARLIPNILTLTIYSFVILSGVFGTRYSLLLWILSIDIISNAFNINFFFQGNEEFGKIVVRNIVIKSLSILAIFAFVKTADDLWLYTLIQVSATFFGNISLWFYLPVYLVPVHLKELRPFLHFRPSLVLFLPTIATSVYTFLDKTMIGLITGSDAQNGNYEYAEKIVKIAMTLITALGTVMIPRNSQNFASGNMEAVKRNIYQSCRFVIFLGFPMMMGLIAIADNLIPWYLGQDYSEAANLIKILSPITLIIGFSNVFGLQFLLPCRMDIKYTTSIVLGAFVNFFINLFMINCYGAYGAAVSTVIAEIAVTGSMMIHIRKYFNFRTILFSSWKSVTASSVMFAVITLSFANLSPSFLHTLLMITIGSLIYCLLLIVLRDSFMKYILSTTISIVHTIRKKTS